MAGLPLVENPIKKTPDHISWFGREIRGLRHLLSYIDPTGVEVRIHRDDWQIIVGESPKDMEIWGQPVRFDDINPELEDGFLARVRAGCHTPPQWNGTDHKFTEVPWLGRLVFLHVNTRGEFTTAYFEVRTWENVDLVPRVTEGEIMCWCALNNQRLERWSDFELEIFKDVPHSPAMFIEHETPGFVSARLETVPWGLERMGETPIPREFWRSLKKLEEGDEESVFNKNNLR